MKRRSPGAPPIGKTRPTPCYPLFRQSQGGRCSDAYYVIRVDDEVAGFVLVRPYPGEPKRMEIGDFFVARKFKGRGVGKVSAFQAFDAHPGKWTIRVLDENRGARVFWGKILEEYTQGSCALTAEKFSDPHSGTWDMQFYRFDSGQSNKTSGGDVQ